MFFSLILMRCDFVGKQENSPLEGGITHTHCALRGSWPHEGSPNHLVEMPTAQISCYRLTNSFSEHRSESLWPNQLQV